MSTRRARAHAVAVAERLESFFFLLILPLLRGAFTVLRNGGLAGWLRGVWLDVLLLAALLVYALWERQRLLLSQAGGLFTLCRGVFFQKRVFFRPETAGGVCRERSLWLRFWRAGRLAFWLPGPRAAKLPLARVTSARFFCGAHRAACESRTPRREFRASRTALLFLAFSLSGSLAGALLLALTLSRLGELLGVAFSSLVWEGLTRLSRLLALHAQPTANLLAWLLLAGRGFGFLRELFRCWNFHARRGARALRLRIGIFPARAQSVPVAAVAALELRQSLLGRLLGLSIGFLHLAAAPRGRAVVFLPALRPGKVREALRALLPEFFPTPAQLRPNRGSLLRYLGTPLWCLGTGGAAFFLGWLLFPAVRAFLTVLAPFLLFPGVCFLLVRLFDFLSAGLSLGKGCLTLRASRGFALCTFVLPAGHVPLAELRQSLFQRLDGRADLTFTLATPAGVRVRLRGLEKQKTLEFLRQAEETLSFAQKDPIDGNFS